MILLWFNLLKKQFYNNIINGIMFQSYSAFWIVKTLLLASKRRAFERSFSALASFITDQAICEIGASSVVGSYVTVMRLDLPFIITRTWPVTDWQVNF